jgi:Pyruvate/2-oxoacid:ferredoxin oxidoreductase delta subunit
MAIRKIIEITEELCDGCGQCIPACPEGALKVVDGKVRLLSEAFCDGLGACIGECPRDAIRVVEREAAPYDERTVMTEIICQGPNVVRAHLDHLADHGEENLLAVALAVLKEKGIDPEWRPPAAKASGCAHGGCPGAATIDFRSSAAAGDSAATSRDAAAGPPPSQLRQWPIQLHLVNPVAPYYRNADVLLAADCTAFAVGGFHSEHLAGRALAIACPKLDEGQEVYLEKLVAMIDEARIRSLTVMIMQVPCCGGLAHLAREAAAQAKRAIPMIQIVVSLQGEILSETPL